MTDAVELALIASIAPTFAALATLIVSIRNTTKLSEIHTLTNSNLNRVVNDLVSANAKIDGLQKLIAEMRSMRTNGN